MARFYFNSSFPADFSQKFVLDIDSKKFSDSSVLLDVMNGSVIPLTLTPYKAFKLIFNTKDDPSARVSGVKY